jgi:PAS domain S-box-containing protein
MDASRTSNALVVDAAMLRNVLALVPSFVLIVDRDGLIRYINRVEAWHDADEVIGTPAESFIAPGSLAEHRAAMAIAWSTGVVPEYEVEIPSPDGAPQWYRSQVAPLRRESETVAVALQGWNITELKAAQAEIERLRTLIPQCAWCGRIRNERDEWESATSYMSRELSRGVTHGACPGCLEAQISLISAA